MVGIGGPRRHCEEGGTIRHDIAPMIGAGGNRDNKKTSSRTAVRATRYRLMPSAPTHNEQSAGKSDHKSGRSDVCKCYETATHTVKGWRILGPGSNTHIINCSLCSKCSWLPPPTRQSPIWILAMCVRKCSAHSRAKLLTRCGTWLNSSCLCLCFVLWRGPSASLKYGRPDISALDFCSPRPSSCARCCC